MTAKLVTKDSCSESLARLPLEVNVIVLGNDRQNNDLSLVKDLPAGINTEKDTITASKTALSNDYLLHDSENVDIKVDSLIMSVEDNESCETKDNSTQDQSEETRMVLHEQKTPEEHEIHTEKRTPNNTHTQTKRKTKKKRKHRTLNKFLNDLYSKKLDLNIKFSSQEIIDIYNAVKKMINNLAETIGEIDARLSIGEVISVGSAREGTQIIRPCEYDFILTLDVLSKPGTVSITQANSDDANREYMRVKVEDSEIRTLLHDIIDDYYIRGSRSLPSFRKGLRQLLSSAIHQAVLLRSESSVIESTGTLTFKHTKVETHGPAWTTRLIWESYAAKANMDISVDLVPALKLNDILNHVLPSVQNICSSYIASVQNFGSALLMPREGQRFRVTFTEVELLLTSHMSDHHRKCYKLLKYLVNGEPYPVERSETGFLKYLPYLRDSRTGVHSYSMKIAVWDHHYKHGCLEENDLGLCILNIGRHLSISSFKGGIRQPFNKSVVMNPNVFGYPTVSDGNQKSYMNQIRLRQLKSSLEKVGKMPTKEYNYETCRRAFKFTNRITLPFLYLYIAFTVICAVSMVLLNGKSILFTSLGLLFGTFSLIYMFSVPSFFRRHLLTLESRRLTKFRIDTLILFVYFSVCLIGWSFFFLSVAGNNYDDGREINIFLFLSYALGIVFMCVNLPTFSKYFRLHLSFLASCVISILFLQLGSISIYILTKFEIIV